MVTVGATVWRVPAGQKLTGLQLACPGWSAKVVPVTHAVQTRSDEAVGACVCAWPTVHVVTAVHCDEVVPAVAWKVLAGHALHCRSVDAVGANAAYAPAAQSTAFLHMVWPGRSWNCVTPLHGVHVASLDKVGAAVMMVPAAHVRTVKQAAAPALGWNVWPSRQAPHTRSLVGVGAVTWADPAAHVRTPAHAALLAAAA